MKKILALLALLAAPAFAQDRYPASSRPTCTVGSPRAVMLFKQTDEDDCDATNSGTADAYCECKCTDRTDPLTCAWTPVSEGTGGGGLSSSDIDTSTELRGIVTDEVGTGALVFVGAGATGFFGSGAVEAVRGGTGSAPTGDDYVPIAISSSAIAWAQIPSCSNAATSKLLYNSSTNTLSCGTDQDGSAVNGESMAHAWPSPSALDDEFNAGTLDAKWTPFSSGTTNPITSGTVGLLSSLTTPIYDAASVGGHLCFQSDNSTAKEFGVSQSVTLSTDATIMLAVSAPNQTTAGANRGIVFLQLINASDTNEFAMTYLGNSGTGLVMGAQVSNNGSLSPNFVGPSVTEGGPHTIDYLFVWKSSNTSTFGTATRGDLFPTIAATGTKTGVTTLDTVRIVIYTGPETPSMIRCFDFFRYSTSLVTDFLN